MVGADSFERLVDRCRHGANVRELPPPAADLEQL